MTVRKGTYILVLHLGGDIDITVGAKGLHRFAEGMYIYTGSAMGGLDQRISRHLAHEKKLKWHIDYLTTRCDRSEAWISYPDFIPECTLAHMAEECGGTPEMDGFGCSDCGCRTHLFRADAETVRKLVVRARLVRFRTQPL